MSLEKMDELFGITDDLLRIMDENQRERAASRTVAELDDVGLVSLYTNATTVTASGDVSGKRNTRSSISREQPPAYWP